MTRRGTRRSIQRQRATKTDFGAWQGRRDRQKAQRAESRVGTTVEDMAATSQCSGAAALTKAANQRAEAYRLQIEWAFRQPGTNGRPISFRSAANKLNERNIESSTGRRWTGQQLLRMGLRLGIHHPRRLPREVARVRVNAIWEQDPGVTGEQVIARLGPGPDQRLGLIRVRELLRDCRMAAARRNPAQRKLGWRIDHWTAARARVCAIWKLHPEFTAKQVLEKLGPQHSVNVWWVRGILHEC